MLFSTRTALALLFAAAAVSARTDGKKRQAELDTSANDVEKRSEVVSTSDAGLDEDIEKRGFFNDVGCGLFGGTACLNSVNTQTDTANCGKVGNQCPSSYANGQGSVTCSSGVCTSSCKSGFGFVAGTGCIQTTTDPNNCGSVGNA